MNNKSGVIDPATIQPKTDNQRKLLESLDNNILTIALGPAGTGKTLMMCKYVAENLKSKINENGIEKIVISRPTVGVGGKEMGFLPGTLNKKMNPWLAPIMQYFKQFGIQGDNKIERQPLYLVRGMNYENSLVFIDECQNLSYAEMKSLLTRLGDNSKILLSGDPGQADCNLKAMNSLNWLTDNNKISNCEMVKFTHEDILRSEFCKEAVIGFEEYEEHVKSLD